MINIMENTLVIELGKKFVCMLAYSVRYHLNFKAVIISKLIGEFSLPTAQATSVPPSAQASCNFDYGLCHGWSQSSSDIFDWTRQRGSTSSSNTGPSSDHTTGNGTYIHTVNNNFKRE